MCRTRKTMLNSNALNRRMQSETPTVT
uniref:Uncharacterized protein n=1 Tax=Arundo donax TaxID=35708 RepID=A0A0A9GE83_ARUDO